MKNKKLLIFSMAVCLAAALFGCGKNRDSETAKNEISETAVTTQKTDKQETETVSAEQQSEVSKMTTISEGTYKNMKVPAVFKEIFLDKKEVITKKGSSSLTEYLCNDEFMNSFEDFDLTLSKYVCIDLDGDGTEEVILLLTTYDSDWVILHYENDKVYAYDYIPYRGISDMKSDGSMISSSGARAWSIYTVSFDKTEMHEKELASCCNGEYKIGEKSVTKKQFDKYEEKWQQKADADVIETDIVLRKSAVETIKKLPATLEADKKYQVDLNEDTFNETIFVSSKPGDNGYNTYKLYINQERAKKAEGVGVHLQIVDIDTHDNYKEIVFYTNEVNNVLSNFTIYRYDGNSCKKISKEVPSVIRRELKIGNNTVSFINDDFVSSMGCYEYSEKYELKNDVLVNVNNTGVRQIVGQTIDYKYKTISKLDLYKSYTSKSPETSIKAGTKIKIDRVYSKAFIKNKSSDKDTWARVKIKDKVAGWIKLPEGSSEDDQIFEKVPSWG